MKPLSPEQLKYTLDFLFDMGILAIDYFPKYNKALVIATSKHDANTKELISKLLEPDFTLKIFIQSKRFLWIVQEQH